MSRTSVQPASFASAETILSFCIPIFNCAEFIGAALDSILTQLEPGVEIIVLDGASDDNTREIVESYLSPTRPLRYVRLDRRGGIDSDLAHCVSLASSKYCWLFSGDDELAPGAITRCLEALRSDRDVYVCNHTDCNREMVPRGVHLVLDPDMPLSVDWADQQSRGEWLAAARSTEALFSFISTIIVRRSFWLAGRLVPDFCGSCWAHVARLLELGESEMRLEYVPVAFVAQRGENDSFRSAGIVARYALAVKGYFRLCDTYFSSAAGFQAIRRCLRYEFSAAALAMARLLVDQFPERESGDELELVIDRLYPRSEVRHFPTRWAIRFAPLWLLRGIRMVWIAARPSSSFARMWRGLQASKNPR